MLNNKSFSSAFKQHKGKVSIKYDSYLKLYDQIFQQHYDCQINLLEIGVQNGGSLEIYTSLFAKIKNFTLCLTIGCIANNDINIFIIIV